MTGFSNAVLTDNSSIKTFCDGLRQSAVVTIDTEFLRDNTFWPKLCLVQCAGEKDGEVAAIDPLAEGVDLSPLFALMADQTVLKVFHAGRQDLEIFYHLTGQVPAPIFDTQIAAMVCGFGENVGYEALVSKLAGAKLDKASRFTDWSQRPLSERQITYALGDVTHLRVVYERLSDRLAKDDRADWVEDDMAILASPETYQLHPEDAWQRLKTRSDDPKFLAVLREVAAWREEVAQRRDVPRSRVVKDDVLMDLAHRAPASAAELERARGLSSGFARSKDGQALLEAIARGKAVPRDQRPVREKRRPSGQGGALVELLKVLLKHQGDAHHVAPRLIASSDDLDRLATEDAPDIPALTGWRRRIFGEDALALKQGKLALTARKTKIALLSLND